MINIFNLLNLLNLFILIYFSKILIINIKSILSGICPTLKTSAASSVTTLPSASGAFEARSNAVFL